jgi:ATP-binding cassette subfamily C protein
MPRLLRIFFSSRGTNQWIVLVCLMLGGIAQGLGLATLVPLLHVASGGLENTDSPIVPIVVDTLAVFGLNPNFETLLLVVVGGMVFKAGLVILAMTYVGYAVAEVATDLRRRLIDALLAVRWSYFVRQPLGSIANAISLEAQRSSNAYAMVAQVLSHTVLSFFYIAVAFLISWRIALVAIALGFVMAAIMTLLVRVSQRAGGKQTRHTRELLTNVSDMLVGIKPLKAMARQGRFARLFETQILQLKKALRRQHISRQALKNLEEPLIAVCLGAGFFFARDFFNTPVPELIVMGVLIAQTVSSISKVQQQIQEAVVEESAFYSVHNMITDAESHAEPHIKGIAPTLDKGCALENVDFGYGEQRVLKDVSIEAEAGKITVITGASGAGKTTITDLLIGLHHAEKGRVAIDGVTLEELDVEAWRGMVGYVPQELILFHDTIAMNVSLGDPAYSDEDVRQALKAADVFDFVESLPEGIQTIVGERGLRTSGGQRQRIALARALVHKPKFLILDEVTSALDPETEQAICENVQKLTATAHGNLTVLAITHRDAWIDAADKVYRLMGEGSVQIAA